MRYLDLFTGIGGFTLAIEQAYVDVSTSKGNKQGRVEVAESGSMHQSEPVAVQQFNPSTNEKDNQSGIVKTGETQRQRYPSSSGDNRGDRQINPEASPICIGYSEINKYAIQIYEKHFSGHRNFGDISAIDPATLPDFDLLTFGWPCQDNSIAGNRRGMDGERSSLLTEAVKILRVKKPKYFIAENVKGLFSVSGGRDFYEAIKMFTDSGYDCQWQVLNTKWFLPQNRERIFFVGHLRGEPRPQVFPIGDTDEFNHEPDKELPEQISNTLRTNYSSAYSNETYIGEIQQLNDPVHSNDRVYGEGGISPTLNTMQGGRRQPFIALTERRTEEAKRIRRETKGRDFSPRRGKELVIRGDDNSNTITAGQSKEHLLSNGYRVRRLTPLECERLQGFPDLFTRIGVNEKGEEVLISDSQRYKVLGNAISVPVVKEIVKRLIR